jgi:hypothetical protein
MIVVIVLATLLILAWSLVLAGAVLNRLAKIEGKVDQLRMGLYELRPATAPETMSTDATSFPSSPVRLN